MLLSDSPLSPPPSAKAAAPPRAPPSPRPPTTRWEGATPSVAPRVTTKESRGNPGAACAALINPKLSTKLRSEGSRAAPSSNRASKRAKTAPNADGKRPPPCVVCCPSPLQMHSTAVTALTNWAGAATHPPGIEPDRLMHRQRQPTLLFSNIRSEPYKLQETALVTVAPRRTTH